MIYAGHNISEDYLYELTEYLKDKKFGVINISKSGTTTETALAFRLLKKQCEDQRGKETAKKVIVAVTDAKKGAARVTADKEGYKTFHHPRQRRRTFLCAHSGWFAADRRCRIRHRQTGSRRCRHGKGLRNGRSVR